MATPNSVFKEVIFDVIHTQHDQIVYIDAFYSAAARTITFDAADLASTILRGKETGEESWKRNLRNCLQTLKTSGELVNAAPGYWRLPSPDINFHLDAGEAWAKIRAAAQEALNEGVSWASPVISKEYSVDKIEGDAIYLKRERTNSVASLTRNNVTRAMNSLNSAGGSLKRRAMINTVAKESAIVFLHPELKWSSDLEYIQVAGRMVITLQEVTTALKEASDDDIEKAQLYARKIRKGQARLRANLLTVYNGLCCISGTGPENVLQAAHIEPHSSTGNNNSTNALLLRSDLHDLFDDGLLLIEPVTLKVLIHPSLTNTYYYKNYNGRPLLERSDGQNPDPVKLAERWEKDRW